MIARSDLSLKGRSSDHHQIPLMGVQGWWVCQGRKGISAGVDMSGVGVSLLSDLSHDTYPEQNDRKSRVKTLPQLLLRAVNIKPDILYQTV